MITGKVLTVCPVCGTRQKVTVSFRHLDTTFEDTTVICINCNSVLIVTDNNHLPTDVD